MAMPELETEAALSAIEMLIQDNRNLLRNVLSQLLSNRAEIERQREWLSKELEEVNHAIAKFESALDKLSELNYPEDKPVRHIPDYIAAMR